MLNGAGDGNRTHTASLEGWNSTIELHPHDFKWWREQGSNLRTHSRADLQSAAFNHSAISPAYKPNVTYDVNLGTCSILWEIGYFLEIVN